MVTHNRHGADDQQAANVTLSHLRRPAQSGPAGGRVLSRHETEPGRKIAPSFECRHRWGKSFDRRGGDGANPRHGLQTDRRLVVPAELPKPLLEFGDLDIEARNMIEVQWFAIISSASAKGITYSNSTFAKPAVFVSIARKASFFRSVAGMATEKSSSARACT
jgi:hypothetical protein